jgi:formylmethanofuran dehydrogenase subunit E
MTEKISNTVFIAAEDSQECELCGEFEECRPAGPNGEQVCWDCANKDQAAMARYADRLFGAKQ